MKIGIGLPATIPGTQPQLIFDWARKADNGPFSSLAVLDRLVYPNYEPIVTLAAVAGITRRVRLMTTVLLVTLRNAAILAKEAASLDALSGGRLTLGVGVGGREDDFRAAQASFRNRGKRLEQQLALMKQIWSGQPLEPDGRPVGPAPARAGGPELLIGGYSQAAIQRLERFGDGYISGGRAPTQIQQFYKWAEDAWKASGRAGKPRFVGCMYYGLGPKASEGISAYIGNYYSAMGPMAQQMANSISSTPEAVKNGIQALTDIGADEVVLWPCIPNLEQVDRLADVIG